MTRKLLTAALAACALAAAASAIAGPPAGSGAPAPPTVSSAAPAFINAYGDSLTAGNQDYSGVTLSTALTKALGIPVLNGGISSQKSTQIAMRQGGVAIRVTLSGNQLNYNQTTITALNGVALAGMATTQDPDYRFLSNLGNGTQAQLWGTLCGIHGQMSRSGSGGPPTTAETYQFTPDGFSAVTSILATSPQACPANSVFTPDNLNLAAPAILWMGQNNTLSTQTAQVESDIDASVAALTGAGNGNYLVLGLFNAEYEASGSQGATNKAALNARNASTYGAHFVDVGAILQSNYNAANPVDVYDHAQGIAPYSLRAVSSQGTLAGAIGDTSTCSFSVTPAFGALQNNGVLKVDSEYILVTSFSGNAVTACTRGYGTGGVAATHASGAHYGLTDPLHIGGNADTLIANYIATNKKAALLGNLPGSVITPASLGAILSGPLDLSGQVFFDQTATFARGINLFNGSCIWGPSTSSVGAPATPISNGTPQPIVCYNAGSGTITVGGVWNTKICFTIGGTAGCTVQLNSKGDIQASSTYTVSNLPTCNATEKGTRTWVSDGSSPAYLSAVTGGGSTVTPVFCNGTAWVAD